MKITYYGASGLVTGSSYLVETTDYRLLIDCGMFQGSKTVKELNYKDFPYDPSSIDAVILTHAHIDHSGLIPKLIKKGYSGPIYASPVTVKLCSIMLPDSGHIQEMEVERKNRKLRRADMELIEPIYNSDDALNAIKHFKPTKYGTSIELSETISFQLVNAGHILGSAQIVLSIKEGDTTKKVVFSGDLGSMNQPYVKDPKGVKDADIVIMESTYGNRVHADKSNRLDILADVINSAQAKGGNIIIPAFAVERTQDLLYYLQELQKDNKIPTLPIYIDSPLAIAATKIFRENPENFDDETVELIKEGNNPLTMENLRFSQTTEDSMKLNDITQGAIIISASGMADAGRIKHHLKHNLWRSNATVIFVGYQAEGTLGRRLIEGCKEVTIHGEKIAVQASIEMFPGFSSHSDQKELLNWVETTSKESAKIVLVHGEKDSLNTFADLIEEQLRKETLIPELGESIEFRGNDIIRTAPEKPWLEAIEEQQQVCPLPKQPDRKETQKGFPIKKAGREKRILLSEVNHSYTKVRKDLKLLVEKARKERDYTLLLDTFEKISALLQETRKKS
ncbi:MAG: MBL fold metallo-hydrolase [Gracilibacter sp. BRH_c7a]|nr:MAG: MBL fold metallo-hydrolase [Gracilibacter sp. BRH_c7a]